MFSEKDIIQFLQKDIIKNVNIINFIENNPIYYMKRYKDSIIVKGKSDENWIYISSSSSEELIELLKTCEEDEFFFVAEDWMIPFILNGKELDWKLSCMKLVFPEDIDIPKSKEYVRQLNVDEAEYIYNNSKYKEYTDIEYIQRRIIEGPALGIYDGDVLAGWAMTHDDGAIGFLNILTEYRKRGYGYELTIAMIDKLREVRKIPFVHIEEDNDKSMSLALKTGFVKDRLIHWIKRK